MIDNEILLQIPGLLAWKDRQGNFQGCNAAFAKAFGLSSPNQIIGMNNHNLMKDFFPEAVIREFTLMDMNVIQQGKIYFQEELNLNELSHLDKYISHRCPLYNENNEIIGMIVNALPYGHIRSFEKQIIEYSAGHIYWKDRDFRYLGCNKQFAEYMGLESVNELIGRRDCDFQPPHVTEQIMKNDELVILMGEKIRLEEKAKSIHGRVDYFLTEKKPLENNMNEIIGVTGNSIIITKQKKSQEVKNNIIMSLSHDLRTPFTGIKSVADLLMLNETDDMKREMLNHIIVSSEVILENLNSLINLAISDLDEDVFSDFNIRDLINKIINSLKAITVVQRTAIKLDCPNQFINADRHRLEKIIYNLVSNAIKFTENGLIEITITLSNIIHVSVKDSGIGISAENLNKIFQLFYKVQTAQTNDIRKGTGVGLFLTKKFIDDMNGEIYVESEPGVGTEFQVSIPYATKLKNHAQNISSS